MELKQRHKKREVPASAASLPSKSTITKSGNKKQKTQKVTDETETEVEIVTLSFSDAFSAGLAFEQLKSLDGAIAAFQRAVECQPNHLETLVHLADVQSAAGQTEAALKCYKQASELKDGKKDASVWFRLGLTHAAMMQQMKATKAYKKSLQLSEERLKAVQNTKDEDIAQLEKAYGVTLAALAEAYVELGDLDSAVKVFEDAVLKLPDNANMHYNLAIMRLAKRGSTGDNAFDSEVVQCLERAIQLSPETLDFVKDLAEYLETHDRQPGRVRELELMATELAKSEESGDEHENENDKHESDEGKE